MTLSILVLLMAQIGTTNYDVRDWFQEISLATLPILTRHPRIELPEPRPVEYHPCGGGWVNGSCRDGGGSPEPFAFGSSADMDDFCAVKNAAGEWIPVSCRKLAHAILNSERTHP